MPTTKAKKHPFVAKIKCEADIRGVSDEELAVTMRMSERTFTRRKSKPEDLSAEELIKLAKRLKLEIVITGDGMDCKQ